MLDFKINLQLFSEEKTEPATPKRLREAREKGQVIKSREAITALMLLLTFWGLKILSNFIYGNLLMVTHKYFNFYEVVQDGLTIEDLMNTFIYCTIVFAKVAGPILLIAAFVALLGNYLQVGFLFTLKPLKPSFNKVNPIEGFKRLFSKNAFVELIKSIIKIGIIGYILYAYLKSNYTKIPELLAMDLGESASFIGNMIINIGIRAAVVLLILSVFDYAYQRWDYNKNLRMTKQEIKEEYKQTEGNPQIKSKIKEKQRQLSLRRMMTEVPKADVIITNPTHFAVAVKYDSALAEAPLVIAKGKDLIAQKIKDIAKDNRVPVVENKPLAQALYKNVEIGNQIPADLYKGVAEVLAFVYGLKNK